eukprot:XP_011605324.1 PREDICTED: UPF0606 protein KIAA1549-like [Takifugu rubripes]
MAGSVSSAGLVVMLSSLLRIHGQHAVLLGLMVLVTVSAADPYIADEPLQNSTYQLRRFFGDVASVTRSPPSALPSVNYKAFESPESPGAQQSTSKPRHNVMAVDSIHFKWENITSETSTPLKAIGTNDVKYSLSPTPTRYQQPDPETSSSLSRFASLTESRLSLNSGQELISHHQQDRVSEQTLAMTTSLPGHILHSANLASADYPINQSYNLDIGPSNGPLEWNQPAHDINVPLQQDDVLTPEYNVPFILPHPTSPSFDPTDVSPDDFYPTNTMEIDWGSGDYLETMTFLDSIGEDYSPVTKVLSDVYDLEDYTESYDTAFPSRVGIFPSSLHPLHISPSPSLRTYSTAIHASPLSSVDYTVKLTPTSRIPHSSDVDWTDAFTIQPTDVLLPDMNSLEYYTTQLTRENKSVETGAEHRNVSMVSLGPTEILPTSSFISDTKFSDEGNWGEASGFEPQDESTVLMTAESPQLKNTSVAFLDPSIVPTHFFNPSFSSWDGQVSTTNWPSSALTPGIDSTALPDLLSPTVTPLLPNDVIPYSSLTDVHWFVTESVQQSSVPSTIFLTSTTAFSAVPTTPVANTTSGTAVMTVEDSTTEQIFNISLLSTESTVVVTSSDILSDQGVTEDGTGIPATLTLIPPSNDANTVSDIPVTTTATNASHQAVTTTATNVNIDSTTSRKTATVTASRQYFCDVDRPVYLVKIGFPPGVTVGYAKSHIKDILKAEFNRSVELQVVDPPPRFLFRTVSGPVVYTAISVTNALRKFGRRFLSVSPNWTTPDRKYHIHTVLQFVPGHIDVRFCNFSESIEKGLTMAFAEVRRRSKESTNFTVHIVNITMAAQQYYEQQPQRKPVDITFTVRSSRGYLTGSEVSNALMKLTVVEFSYYMGFPVLQIAEPFHYPELNTSQLLRSSWLRTVLLGVMDHKVGERTFQANMERRVAMILGEAMGSARRVKRATAIGNSSVQVVSTSRLVGTDHPLEIVYFVEGPDGQRMPADQAAYILNRMDVQRAAIILGYRVQGVLAQPVEKVASAPSDTENTNLWIVVGVVIPLLVVIIIISILYWKLCRTDKLEFQPDAMTSIQQRQKLQAPTVKGFDFAKLHLGQHSKDDVMVIQEAAPPGTGSGPLPMPAKDGLSRSDNGELPAPISKNSTKASRSSKRHERISPSDGDSVVSDHSSEREPNEENRRGYTTPSDGKHTRKVPINVLNGPPPMNGTNEQLSSASIFEHVDRLSRGADASRRLPSKVQLIAMQPMPLPPLHGTPINDKLSDANQITREIQVALRHKSEIEHHRNKIRLRAKRKGHYDFPAMDDLTCGLGNGKDQDQIYQKAPTQIVDPEAQMPMSIFTGSKKSGRARRSPKQRVKEQLNGGAREADKDHLISEDSEGIYRRCPGVNNVAYVSDPDQGQCSPHRSPSPTDDVFLGPTCSPPGHAPPPPPYMPPQPSIEEARQQMHSLLDDAFALVSPTSQGNSAGITLPGVNTNPPTSSPPSRGPRQWIPSYSALGPFPGRYSEVGISQPSVHNLMTRQALGSSYLPSRETAGQSEQLQPDSLYSSRGLYTEELLSSARPRPVGGSTGAQLHHLAQVGLPSRVNGHPAGLRASAGHGGGISWSHYHDNSFSQIEPEKETFLDCLDYPHSSIFQTPRSFIKEPAAPPVHIDPPGVSYVSSAPPLQTSPPTHSSASLIKAIREELLRLSQKQSAVPSYHS